jgi:hypothetical protein
MVKKHGQQSSKHCQTSSNNMVKHRQHTWSTIVKTHGQQSSNNMVNNRQKTWSTIVKQHGQTSSTHIVA